MKYLLALIIISCSILICSADDLVPALNPSERAWVAEGHTVRVRVANWPPYQIHKGGELTGISVDYIKTIFKRYGIKYKLVSSETIPWKEAIEDIKNHKRIDLLLTAKVTEERKKHMLFTFDYVTPPWVIYTRDNIHDISSMSDLNGRTVAAQEGFVVTKWLRKNYPDVKLELIRGTDTTSKALRAVATSKADAYIGNLATGSYFVHSLNLHNLKVVGVTPLGDDQNAMAVRKDWPELVSIINKSLLGFSEKYKLDVMSNYYSVKYEHGVDYVDIALWVTLTAFALGFVIIYVLNGNKKLNREIEQRLKAEYETNEYLSIIDENVITITVDSDGVITSASNEFCRVSKTKKEDIIGKNFLVTWSQNMPDDMSQEIHRVIKSNQKWSGEIEKIASDGSKYWIKTTVSPKFSHDGIPLGYISVGHDITDKKLVERLSITDRVTETFNRFKLDEIFAYELAQSQRYKHIFSVIILDLDDFKNVNDTFGHQTGDIVLKMVSNILVNNTRVVDTVGRWGGDEFLLICPETTTENAYVLAEKIRYIVSISEFPRVGNKTVSIGIAGYNDGDTQEAILERADKALYKAKKLGKNMVVL